MHQRSDGLVECGHEPFHTSKSGHCVLINASAGSWWCRSCRQSGDAAAFVMAINGWPYAQAADWLAARYGRPARHTALPAQPAKQRRSRVRWRDL
jgi:DNA primase